MAAIKYNLTKSLVLTLEFNLQETQGIMSPSAVRCIKGHKHSSATWVLEEH